MISILKKELRDCLKWVPAGMLIAVVMVWQVLPDDLNQVYYGHTSLTASIGWSAALIAFALGLLQSLFDIRNDARGYLLHRPVPRRNIFWAKLAAGFIAYILALTPAVLLAAIYLNRKGFDFLPVSGSQVVPGVILTLGVFLLHPIALWIGNRDAKWVGTRVLPLAGIVPIILTIYPLYSGFAQSNGRYWILLTVGIWAIHILAFIIVLMAARHAFCNRQMLPPANGKNASSWFSILGLTFSAIVVATAVSSFVIQTLDKSQSNYSNRQLLMNTEGEFQQVNIARDNWNEVNYSVRPADASTDEFAPVADQWKLAEYSVLTRGQREHYSWFKQFKQMGDFGTGSKTRGPVSLFGHRGRLLAYERGHLSAIISPQSVSRDGTIPDDQFQKLSMLTYLKSSQNSNGPLGKNPLLVDATGVYQFDSNTFEMSQLLPKSVDRICMLFPDERSPATLWTVTGDTLTQHLISWINGDSLTQHLNPAIKDDVALNEIIFKNHTIAMPLIKIDESKSFKIDSLDSSESYSISVFRADDGRYGYVKYNSWTKEQFYGFLEEDGGVAKLGPVVIPSITDSSQDKYVLGIPPVAVYGVNIGTLLFAPDEAASTFGMTGFAILQTLLAAIGTLLLCKWLDLSSRHRWAWTIFALFAGWGACLAVVACHRRLVKEACSHCKTPTRVDMENCTQCGKQWLPPELDQIEIFDDTVVAA